MKKVILTYAVKDEFVPVTLSGCEVRYVHTGIGKARAAMKLTEAICADRPHFVLNMGTAGSLNHAVGDIFVCRRFIDRDYHLVQLPGVGYELDFSEMLTAGRIGEGWTSSNGVSGTCNTGDSFVTEAKEVEGDVVEMEAFAQAIVCKEFDLPFIAVKFVTDIIGQNSVQHWEDKLSDAREGFKTWFEDK